MIKFFRKIRHKLLTENKFSKYLIYAIGEIVLVVIGILIALGINDYNQELKNRSRLTSNTTLLIKSLEADSLYIARSKQNALRDKEFIIGINQRLKKSIVTIDTLVQIARNEFKPAVILPSFANDATYNTLVLSGEINLYDKELIEEIYKVYRNQAVILKRAEASFQTYLQAIGHYKSRYTFNDNKGLIPNGPLLEKVWNTINEADFIASFNSLLSAKLLVYDQTGWLLLNHENEINELLTKLRKNLADG